jgi:hypothetical protein
MKYGTIEYRYAEPFARGLAENRAFREWVLSRTEFSQMSNARLLASEMLAWRANPSAEWWRFHFTEKCRCAGCSGKETDILAIFESPSAIRFALHFEVKHPNDRFKSYGVQSRGYPIRAQCWMSNPPANVLPHHNASTVLLFSEQKRGEFAEHLAHFKTLITFEDIKSIFPHLGLGELANEARQS